VEHDMATLTLRLPDPLDAQLNAEAVLSQLSRSELARVALEKYLREQEHERRMAEMEAAFRFLATNPEARAESLAIAEEFLPLDNEALDIAEGRKPGDPWPEEQGEIWWK
jgi:metal-responsive CopG/Arc/MetJ family transcriptional regulator